ncbi:metallophosphoesterase [Roseibium denhamense]|uniref:3',5'-cyclic AMP phosphodiesterase CpdA n=1 Tax=Roseibium denhamense TaxID=76305 RepID=A0ABY1NGA3_9HYPH|nr:metallophosphoesterase [Roseibium denhamense]MTI06355.1 metallophosphoesterase [Roseibium denhamense]SMP08547.1 3',5'-cyclic AMP phosphodiesterase CpdA [Roseibium denhamense]
MFKLAHLSDPHLGPLPDPKLLQLFSKRLLGYLNWQRNRSKIMGGNYLEQLVEDMRAQAPDHIAVTGDLVNIALPLEISGARSWLETIGAPDNVSVVPGNHDAYVPGAVRRARAAWWPYMSGDNADAVPHEKTTTEATFPYVRRRGDMALVGVTTGRASAPWFATGRVGSKQSKRLRDTLEMLGGEGLFRIVMLHHPPFPKATGWHKRLSDASRVRAVIKRAGAELLLHGHTHIDSFETIEGPSGPVPVVGVPSATSAPGGKKPPARYNLFSIKKTNEGWVCQLDEHGFTEPDQPVELIASRQVEIPQVRPALGIDSA